MLETSIHTPGENRQPLVQYPDLAPSAYSYSPSNKDSSTRYSLSNADISSRVQSFEYSEVIISVSPPVFNPFMFDDQLLSWGEDYLEQHESQGNSNESGNSLKRVWRSLLLSKFYRLQQIGEYTNWLSPIPARQVPTSRYLADALEDLHDATEEAMEDGFPVPSRELLDASEQLLKKLYEVWPHRFEVYPMPDGEIAIDAPNRRGSSVLVMCEPGGGVLCMVNNEGKHRRKRYLPTDHLPDAFLIEALSSLLEEAV